MSTALTHFCFSACCELPRAQEGEKPVEHGQGCRTFACNSAGEVSQIFKFAAGEVFWVSLILFPIRKMGALSLGETGDVAPEKPEGI